jgi:Phosphotransferase enzyme family
VPRHRRHPSFVHCDSGQFLFEGGHLTAVLDFDVAHVGDPLVDLASLRLRDLAEPLGDIPRAFRRYEDLTGEPIDRDALDFHTVQWSLCTPLSTARIVHNPPPDSDPILYLEWYLSFARVPLEIIGRRLGLELPAIEPPPPRPTRRGWANAALVNTLGALSVDDEFDGYRLDVARRLARYLALADAQGPALDEEERDDVAELAGRVPLDAADAERAVMEVVHSSGPERDGELTAFFHRQVLRQLVLVGPVSSRSGDRVMQDIDG